MRRWAVVEPAAARVVPREERKIEGGGVMEESWVGQIEESVEVRAWSLGEVEAGARRASVWTEEMEGRARRVERMCEPCCATVSMS